MCPSVTWTRWSDSSLGVRAVGSSISRSVTDRMGDVIRRMMTRTSATSMIGVMLIFAISGVGRSSLAMTHLPTNAISAAPADFATSSTSTNVPCDTSASQETATVGAD